MPFQNTPKELRARHETLLDPSCLSTYVSMAAEAFYTAEAERRRLPYLKSQKYFIAAGCSLVQRPPRNLSDDPDEILEKRAVASDELKVFLNSLKKRAHFQIKPPNRGDVDHNNFSIKGEGRFYQKAEEYVSEKLDERPFSRVADTIRTTIKVKHPRDLQKISELTRPCVNPYVVRHLNSFFQTNLSPLRRLMVNFRGASGVCSELQVIHSLSEKFYDASEDQKHMERDANAAMVRGSRRSGGAKAVRSAGKTSQKAKISRDALNAQAASIKEVSVLQGSFEYFSVDGFPIAINHDTWEGRSFSIVPNPLTGLWETDHRFEELQFSDKADQITPREAELMAEAMAQSIELRRHLQVG